MRPSFKSPRQRNEGLLRFVVRNSRGRRVKANVYVGRYEARVTPIADTVRKTKRPARARFVPGRYQFLVKARGYGMFRFARRVPARTFRVVRIRLQRNWASRYAGARARGEGERQQALIDDTERTNWAVRGRSPSVRGARITVNLGGRVHMVRRVNVSAMLRPAKPDDPSDPSQNRFSALRRFRISVCRARPANRRCSGGRGYVTVFRSSPRAFPGSPPRPVVPALILRSFNVRDRRATHVRLVVLSNQCTGARAFHGEKDNDPTNVTDCRAGSAQDQNVRVAELQVFSGRSRAR